MLQTIRSKLLGTMSLLCLTLLAVAGIGYRARTGIDRELENATSNLVPSAIALGRMSTQMGNIAAWTRGAILESEAKKDGVVAKMRRLRDRAFEEVDANARRYESLPMSDEEARLWRDAKPKIADFRAGNDAIWAAVSAGDLARARETATANVARNDAAIEVATALLETQAKIGDEAAKRSADMKASANAWLVATIVLSLLLAVLAAGYLANAIAKPLAAMTEVAGRIAVGDVDVRVEHRSADEIGALADAFRASIDYLAGAAAFADAIRRGDLSASVTPRSEKDRLSKNLVAASETLKVMLAGKMGLIAAAKAGDLQHRADVSMLEGIYAQLVGGANSLVDAFLVPVKELRAVLDRVAARDLTARMTGAYGGEYDKMKQAFNLALDNLEAGFSQIALASEQVGSAVVQISQSSQAVATGASQQASALEETGASLEQMASATRQNAESAAKANELAAAAKGASSSGSEAMQQMRAAMEKIRGAAEGTAAIIKDINEIAFQTNLLALNAAVEAARAGDAGRGFAVVAEEVRSLALRAKEAARKTESLILESVELAQRGQSISKDVGAGLEGIVDAVTRVSAIVADIATASGEQARGIGQVNQAVAQMDQVTQQNAANSEESASAAQELAAQAQEMTELVGRFRVDGVARGTAPRTTTSASAKKPPALVARPRGAELDSGIRVLPKKSNGHAAPRPDGDAAFRDF